MEEDRTTLSDEDIVTLGDPRETSPSMVADTDQDDVDDADDADDTDVDTDDTDV